MVYLRRIFMNLHKESRGSRSGTQGGLRAVHIPALQIISKAFEKYDAC
jgi:hypothetical protein